MSVQQRVRYHQFMRPRHDNPTYASFSVGATLNVPPNSIPQSKSTFVRNNSLPSLYHTRKMSDQVNNPIKGHKRSSSHLSNYGSSSLRNLNSQLPRNISEREIYEKQQKKYNIISMDPISHKETIKKYPIYRLQNSDYNYFKKQQLQKQYQTALKSKLNPQTPNNMPAINKNM